MSLSYKCPIFSIRGKIFCWKLCS